MFIEMYIKEEIINSMLENFNEIKDELSSQERETLLKNILFLKHNNRGFEVTTLEEYFEKIEMISELTDGSYKIYNCGKFIDIDY